MPRRRPPEPTSVHAAYRLSVAGGRFARDAWRSEGAWERETKAAKGSSWASSTRDERLIVKVRVPKRFVNETLWPEFQELRETLYEYLGEVADRVISQAIHADSSEAVERQEIAPPAG